MDVDEPIIEYSQLDLSKEYTYFDYLKWRFTERVELIFGKIVKMSPAPNTKHQSVSSQISRLFLNYFHLIEKKDKEDIRHEKGHMCSTFVQMNKGATNRILKYILNDNI